LHATSEQLPAGEDEFAFAGLTCAPSKRVTPPRVAEAKAHMECVLSQIVRVGNGNLVIGRVIHLHVAPCVWRQGRIDPALFDPVVRLSRCYGALANRYTSEEEPASHVRQ
jgi:flavin reductase (DIM6/NTAB) family NADH-FMN oxidoreductase RutF